MIYLLFAVYGGIVAYNKISESRFDKKWEWIHEQVKLRMNADGEMMLEDLIEVIDAAEKKKTRLPKQTGIVVPLS